MQMLTSRWSSVWDWLAVPGRAVQAKAKAKDRRLNMSIFLWNGLALDSYYLSPKDFQERLRPPLRCLRVPTSPVPPPRHLVILASLSGTQHSLPGC
ncbi:hypothetical protein, partial [Falsiroseomonas sp. E2-1-a20]|uniref:hypothetical protein n=1 Tax=Falsiroseomonas sp. E2-1-a20 TaxID=3239300 RepID=UPI003F3E2BA5